MDGRLGGRLVAWWIPLTLGVAALPVPAPARAQAPETMVVFDGPSRDRTRYVAHDVWFTGMAVSPDGSTVWVGTPQALLRFTGAKVEEFRTDVFGGATCDSFLPLAVDPSGTLWVALRCYARDEASTLATFDGATWRLLNPTTFPTPDYARRPDMMVFGSGGVMWAATYFGLVRHSGTEWMLFTPQNSAMPHQDVAAMHVDAQGALWLGFYGGHLARFDGTEWEVFLYSAPSAIGLTSNQSPKSFATDGKGGVYFTYHGTSRLHRRSGAKWETAPCPPSSVTMHTQESVFDGQGVLWIAHDFNSQDGVPGLFRWDGKACKGIDLPDDSGGFIRLDAAGNKWIATLRGQVIVYREGGVQLAP